MERPDRPPPGAMQPMKGRLPFGRAWNRFIRDPSSGRNAILVIIVANVSTVLVGGLAIWLLDRNEYEHLTDAFWLILQTVTSVGYGDVTPVNPVGRAVAAAVMLLGIAFVSILTASITSVFLDARQQEQRNLENAAEAAHRDRLEARLDDLLERLERIERQGQPPP